MTWSPFFSVVTPGPTSTTTPAPSWPRIAGNRPSGSAPERVNSSVWQTPVALISTSTSPACGPSRRTVSIVSGAHAVGPTAALMSMSELSFAFQPKENRMAKAYWISCYKAIKDQNKLTAYAKLAGPAIQAAGGKFLVRSPQPAKVYEQGVSQRTVVVEFESLAKAIAAHDGPAYQEALRALADGVERDLRIVEGV